MVVMGSVTARLNEEHRRADRNAGIEILDVGHGHPDAAVRT